MPQKLSRDDARLVSSVALKAYLGRKAAVPNVRGDDYETWLRTFFPQHLSRPDGAIVHFAPHHRQIWKYIWALERGVRPKPLIVVLARGGAKSTTCELAVPAVFARDARKYGLYISRTQDQADAHLQNIAMLLETSAFGAAYPAESDRRLSKFGAATGWRHNRLSTAGGHVMDALGMDAAIRGIKFEEARPDWIILDDLDDVDDKPPEVLRRIRVLTHSILAAGAFDLAVIGIQNLVHPDSIFARLTDDRADFLEDRTVIGPIPALTNFAAEQDDRGRWRIVAGEPTWSGQTLADCRSLMSAIGYSAFRAECQHEVGAPPGGLFSHLSYRHCRFDELPSFVKIVTAVDPAVTDTDHSDSHGVQISGLAADGAIYRLFNWEQRATPLVALRTAISRSLQWGSSQVTIETDQGGDTWESVYREAWRTEVGEHAPLTIPMIGRRAGGRGSKAHRASLMLPDYENGKIVHMLGTHEVLERALFRFPDTKPFDLVDTSYWCWAELRGQGANWTGWTDFARAKTAKLRAEAAARRAVALDEGALFGEPVEAPA